MIKTIRKVHLWLGLTCGLIASFSGLTGALYVWQPEITALLNPNLLQVDDIKKLDEKTILKSTTSLMAKYKDSLSSVFLPYREQQTISLKFENGNTAYFDPKNLTFLGEKSSSIHFFENLLSLHRSLGIPRYGKYIVGTSAVLFFLFLLTSGIYMWATAYGSNMKKGFAIQWKGKRKKLNFDIHKAFGAYFIIPLFILALTGSYFTYNSYYKLALSLFDGDSEQQQLKVDLNNPYSFRDYLLRSNESYALRAIHFPKEEAGNYRLRYIKERFLKSGLRRTKEVEIDSDGQLTVLSDFRTDHNSIRIAAQAYPIHIGEMAGLIGRILVFVSGLVPFLLLLTGFNIYRNKKRRKNKKSRNSRAR